MLITFAPFVRFASFNFYLEALDFYFHPATTAGASDNYRQHNSATADNPGRKYYIALGTLGKFFELRPQNEPKGLE